MRKRQAQAFQFDPQLLEEIYDTYQRPIYRSISRKVGDVETAADLTADVFHRLLQVIQNGKGPSRDAKAWLYRTAHNIVVDYYRRQQFRRHDPLEKDIATSDPGPAQLAENQILADAVREALSTLTTDQRQVVSLRFLDGHSCKEVASILGKSTGAVKSLQHRGLANLQRALKQADFSEQVQEPESTQKVKASHPNLCHQFNPSS